MPKYLIRDTRQHGPREALIRFWFRNRAFIGYIALVGAVIYSLYGIQHAASQRRRDLVQTTKQAVRVACEDENQVRRIIAGFLATSRVQTALAVRDHILTKAEAKAYLVTLAQEERQIAPKDCTHLTQIVSTSRFSP